MVILEVACTWNDDLVSHDLVHSRGGDICMECSHTIKQWVRSGWWVIKFVAIFMIGSLKAGCKLEQTITC